MASDSSICDDPLFQCTRCGDCCQGYGGTYISESDIQKISEYISADREKFISDYCTRSGNRLVLRQRPDGYCIFWEKLCTIHPVKPRMCRQWPFLKSVLVDEINWHSMASMCPGIRTEVAMDRVLARIQAFISADPESPLEQ